MMLKNNIIIVGISIIASCCGQKKTNTPQIKTNSLLKEIHRVVDSTAYNLPRPYYDFIYTVTHQQKEGKDYIKVAIADYFNKDSVSTYEIYNEHLLIFYSKNFFEKEFDKLDTIGLKQYNSLSYDEAALSMYHPRYEVIEILGANKFRVLPLEEHHEKKLFYFSDVPEIPEPVPNNSLNSKSNVQNE